ncbi:MAG: pyruvate dehydrogenase [Sulfurimonas sp.]|nr:MAG: pyruvate dehydrogenase [Sulfurimonas sp.]
MYDIIYIGGGLNYAGAVIAAKNGLKVALIEKDMDLLGGVCLHKGCIPSKMFLHYSNSVLKAQGEMFYGDLSLNIKVLVEKKNKLIQSARSSVHAQCKGIDLIEGEGIIKEAHKVSVKDKVYEAKHVVIGTGSSPHIPDGINYDGKKIITSDEALNLDGLPQNISIYGAGAIALEMASFFASCGVEVNLFYRSEMIQNKAHPFIQKSLQADLEKIGIKFFPSHKIVQAISDARGVKILFENKVEVKSELLLIAAGRRANLSVIATKDIQTDDGIICNEYFETSLKNHYAIGDCNAKLQLAHAARAQVLNVTMSILGHNTHVLNLNHVVKFIHTLPLSYASVGLTKDTLDKTDTIYKQSIVKLNNFTISAFHMASNGMMIVYADDDNFIIGAEILAPDAQELISSVAVALAGEMDVGLTSMTIMAHPTFSEALERTYFHL